MKPHVLAILLLTPLGACAMGPGGTYATPTGPAATVVAAAETPLFIASKITTCLGRTPLLLPGAAASTVVPFSKSKEGSGGDYLATNAQADCGPPYWVTAAQVSSEP
ncbi:MAG TPA: hypothetical protein VGL83_07875 [Stellaceae bacterium]|jgi:hypothetical protein